MNRLRLRMRRVIEHPLHFSVERGPAQPALTIAKKGLTPNLEAKLRQYADGGRVVERLPEPMGPPAPVERAIPGADVTVTEPEPLMDAATKQFLDDQRALQEEYERSLEAKPEVIEPAATTDRITSLKVQPAVVEAPKIDVEMPEAEAKVEEPERPAAPKLGLGLEPKAEAKREEPAPAAMPATVKPAAVEEPYGIEQAFKEFGFTSQQVDAMNPQAKAAAYNLARTLVTQRAIDKAEADTAKDAARVADENVKAEKVRYDALAQQAKEMRDIQKAILEEGKPKTEPESYFGRLSTPSQFATALSLAAGAFASGFGGVPNYALQIYNSAVEEDLRRQREKKDSMHQRLVQAGHSVENADELVRAQLKLYQGAEAASAAARIKLAPVQARMQQYGQKLIAEGLKTMSEVAASEAKTMEAGQKAPLERQYLEAKIATEKAQPGYIAAKIAHLNRLKDEGKPGGKVEEDLREAFKDENVPQFLQPALKKGDYKYVNNHRTEISEPEKKPDGSLIFDNTGQVVMGEPKVVYLQDPKAKSLVESRLIGLDTVQRQASELRQWAKAHPSGLTGLVTSPSEYFQERAKLEVLTKDMIEGYIKNKADIRRASTAAIKYMDGVVSNPGKLLDSVTGAAEVRYDAILQAIDETRDSVLDQYAAKGQR